MKIKTISILAGASLLAVLSSIIMAGCASPRAKTSAGSANTTASAAKTTSGKGGAQLWSENCSRCHNIRSPDSYSDAQWDVAMMHMRVRANLTAEEHKKILEFLKSAN
jgi:cytochrome c5